MKTPLRVLIIENSESDTELIIRQLKKAEYSVHHERIETLKDMKAALEKSTWDIVISDYKLSRFKAHAALALLHKIKLDIPFIVVSSTNGEESAVKLMKLGANDYLMKDKLVRLGPVVKRELAKAHVRQEHKNSEEEGRLLAQAFKSTRDCISITDLENKILFVNDSFLATYGYSEAELLGKNISIIRSLIVSSEESKIIQSGTMRSGWHGEIRNKRKNGTEFTVELWTSVVTNDSGKPIALVGVARDITEHKQAEELLQQSENKFKNLFNNAEIGMFRTRLDGSEILDVNKKFLEIFDYKKDEVIGKSSVILWADRREREVMVRRLKENVHVDNFECRMRNRLGEVRHCLTSLVLNPEQGILEGSIIDITERIRAEEALCESEQLFQGLFNASPDAIVLIDPHNSSISWPIVDCNEAACKMNGYTREELIGHSIDVLNTTEGTQEERIAYFENLRKNGTVHVETFHRHKDGHVFPVEVTTSIVTLGGREMVFGIDRDATERKRAETELQKSKTQLSNAIKIAKLGPWEYDVAKDTFTFNDSFFAIFQTTAKQVGGYTMSSAQYAKQFVYPDDLPMVGEEIKKAIETTDPHYSCQLEHRILYADGTIGYIAVRILVVKDAQGNTIKTFGVNQDITERKRAEEAIHQSEVQFKTLFMSMDQGFYLSEIIYDNIGNPCDYRYLEVNPKFEQIIGLSRDQIVGKRYKELVPVDTTQWLDIYCEVARSGKPSTYQFFSNEYRKHFETYSYQPTKSHVTVFVTDITERKRAEKAVRESEEKFRMVFENVLDGISIYSEDPDPFKRKLIDCNERYATLSGRSREELIQLGNTQGLQKPLEDTTNSNRLESLFKGEVYRGSFSWIRPDRKENIIEYVGVPITWQGKPYSIGIDRDVTERKKAEIELIESEERYRRLVEFSPDAIAVHSDGKIVYVNSAAITLLGANSASELIGMPFLDIIHPDYRDSVHQQIIAVMKEEYAIPSSEQKFMRLDGSCVEVEVAALPIVYKEKSAMQIVVRDISEQKKLQNQLMQTQKIQSIGTLAGGIAHDFNNILGIILAYSSLLDKSILSQDKFADSIAAINQAVQRGAALVRQILTFARKTDVVFEPMDISALIHELLSMLEQTFPKTITFSESIENDLPFIFADRTQVHQALLNLCVNARDAMPNGGSISIMVEKRTKEQMTQKFPAADAEAYVCLTVTDTGKGMDEATCLRVFDPFFTTKEKGKGTGLGLSVVYGVVQAHHAFIDFKSETGCGTTFWLFFPVPAINKQTADSQLPTESFEIGGTETILFVEDEEMLIQMVTFLLESKGYKVLCARDGFEAVQIYQSHKKEIALVLTDMGLPVMTGTDEFKKIREINPNSKVIFASGYFEPDLKSELLKDGANGFIQKPYEPNDILRIIRQALDQKV